jgi:putative ABC transport system permease protein
MLSNYVAVGLRFLARKKFYSIINVAGFSIGVACFTLIALFVRYELSFDDYHSNAKNLHRFSRDFFPVEGQPELSFAAMSPAEAPALNRYFPEILSIVS